MIDKSFWSCKYPKLDIFSDSIVIILEIYKLNVVKRDYMSYWGKQKEKKCKYSIITHLLFTKPKQEIYFFPVALRYKTKFSFTKQRKRAIQKYTIDEESWFNEG